MLHHVAMGAAKDAYNQGFVFVGSGSRWHNPFAFEEGESGYLAYKEWFYSSAYAAVRLRKGVLDKLKNKPLMCDCGNTHFCHANVIAEFLYESV